MGEVSRQGPEMIAAVFEPGILVVARTSGREQYDIAGLGFRDRDMKGLGQIICTRKT